MIWMLCALLLSAHGGRHRVHEDGDALRVQSTWVGADHQSRAVEFLLDADAVRQARDTPTRFPHEAAAQTVATAVDRYVREQGWDGVTATVTGSSVHLRVRGKDDAQIQRRLQTLHAVRDAAMATFLEVHGYRRLDDGRVAPDHARIASEHAAHLAQVADALGADRREVRDFARVSLGFVQSVPYEAGGPKQDGGFRLPVSVLAAGRGDCDSKAVLFAGLLKAAHPDLGVAIVVLPGDRFAGHALAAVDLEPTPEQAFLLIEGRPWVLAEVVGPHAVPLGRIDGRTRRALARGPVEVRAVGPI